MLQYALVTTTWGPFGLVRDEAGLRAVFFPGPGGSPADAIRQRFPDAERDDGVFGDLPERLRRYVAGETVSLHDALSPQVGTAFQRRVWAVTCAIPRGQTRTYGEVARELGRPRSARAVGQALAANPCPVVVPCHRVVGAGGDLRGFGGGIQWKERLLQLEGSRPVNSL